MLRTRSGKRQYEASESETSNKVKYVADTMKKRVDELAASCDNLRHAPKGSMQEGAQKMLALSSSMKQQSINGAIANDASAIIRDALRAYEEGSLKEFNAFFDKVIKRANVHRKAAKDVIEKLDDSIEDTNLLTSKISKRQYSSVRNKMDFVGRMSPALGRSVHAISPEQLMGIVNSEVSRLDSRNICDKYKELRTDQLVLKKLGEVSKSLAEGKVLVARTKLRDSSPDALERMLGEE